MSIPLRQFLRCALLLAVGAWENLGHAHAQAGYEEPTGRDLVVAFNTGLRFSIAPAVFIPTGGGDLGFGIAGDARYGFEVGKVVLAPGIRLSGYFPPDLTVLSGLATGRLTVPVGPVGPYALLGGGPGYVIDPTQVGLAYLAGGGFIVHFNTRFGLGAEVTYQGVTASDFAALFVGPTLLLSF